MSDTRYLKRRVGKRRSGDRWYVRVAVPKELRGRFGKLEAIERGLNTGDLREAQRRRHAVVADILEAFDRARDSRPEDAVAEELARAHAVWRQTYLARGRAAVQERLQDLLDAEYMQVSDHEYILTPGDQWHERAGKALQRCGVEPAPEMAAHLAETLLEAHVDAAEAVLEGREPPLPAPGGRREAVRARATAHDALKVSEAGERYLAERTRDAKASLTQQTAAQARTTFRLFAEFSDDAPLDAVTRRDASEFLEALARLHRHYGRQPGAAGFPLEKLLKRYPAADSQGLSNKTLNRHLSALSGLWRWARRRGHLPDDRPNPFSDQMRQPGDNPYLPFTVEELKALFKGLAFEVRPKQHTLTTARPWIMAAALYSGMREGEICDLDAENVRERDGVPYFDVTRAKSKAGVRLIPVHSELIGLGFLDYVAAIGRGPLFPSIPPGSRGGGRAHTFAKRFPTYRRQRGIGRDRLAFHSFRKCFVRALELAGVDRDRAALVVGHERGFTFRVYNPEGLDLAMLREVVEAVRYDGLELCT
jgi:integrase